MPDTVFEKLNEKNYADWHYMMEALLIEKDLWDVVNGTEVHPTGSVNSKAVCAFVKNSRLLKPKLSSILNRLSFHMLGMKTQQRSGKVLNRSFVPMGLLLVSPFIGSSYTCRNAKTKL